MGGTPGKERKPKTAKRPQSAAAKKKKGKTSKLDIASVVVCHPYSVAQDITSNSQVADHDPQIVDGAHKGTVIAVEAILSNAGLPTIADVAAVGASTLADMVCSALPWFMGAVELAGPAVPFFAPVFTLLTRAYGAACAMKGVRADAKELQARLADLAAALWDGYQRRNGDAEPAPMQQKYLERLREVLERAVDFLTKYGKEGGLAHFLKSSAHSEQLRELDSDLTKAVADMTLFDVVVLTKRVDVVEADVKIAVTDISVMKVAIAELRVGKNMLANFQLILRRQHPNLLKVQPDDLVAGLDVYVPLRFGLHRPPLAEGERRFELDELAKALLQGTMAQIAECMDGDVGRGSQCVFVQGMAGTGKTLLGWRMAQMYDQLPAAGGVQDQARIPIIINLPMVADAVRAALSDANSTGSGDFLLEQLLHAYDIPALGKAYQAMEPQQRAALCETGFVFMLDGVDELVDKLPIHKLVSLRQWPNSVFVVAARTGFFSDDREGLQRVCPRDAAGGLLESQMRAIHLLSFDEQQRNKYITAFAGRYFDIYKGWDAERYHNALKTFPQLNEFLTEPLLLFMVLNVLPLLTASSGRMRMDPLSLGVVEVSDAGVEGTGEDGFYAFPVFKRAELYALFTYSWAKREAAKLKLSLDTAEFIQSVALFSEVLAFDMFKKGTTQMSLVSDQDLAMVRQAGKTTGVASQQQRKAKAAVASADAFLMSLLHPAEAGPGSQGKQLEFRCSPIKRSGNTVSFLHKTVQEFFSAMHVLRNLNDRKDDGAAWQADVQQGGYLLQPDRRPYISEKLLTAGNVTNTLNFCADLVDTRVQRYVTLGTGGMASGSNATLNWIQPASMALWDIVQASRLPAAHEPAAHNVAATAAANSLMVLNAAGLQFDGCDFSNAVLGPMPGTVLSDSSFADVSGGIFSHCSFNRSVLRHARLDGCNFTGSCLNKVDLFGVTLGQLPMLLGHTMGVTTVCLSPDGKYVVSGSFDSSVLVWSVKSGHLIRRLEAHTKGVTSVCVTPDSKYIVSASEDDECVRVWLLESGPPIYYHTKSVKTMCATSDSRFIVSGTRRDHAIRVWSLESGKQVLQLDGHTRNVESVCMTPDGKHIVSGSDDKSVRVWSLKSGQQVLHLEGHTKGVDCVCVTPDGKHIVSGSYDQSVRVWSLQSGQQVHQFDGHIESVVCVCATPDGKHVLSGSDDSSIRIWSLESGRQVHQLDGHTMDVRSVCVTRDGKYIVSGSADKIVRLWLLESGQQIRHLDGHSNRVWCVCVTPDGKHIVSSGSEHKGVRIWSLESGQQVRHLVGHTDTVKSVCVTPDGKHIVSGAEDKSVRVWSLESGQQIRHIGGRGTVDVRNVCVTPDGKHIVSCSGDSSLRVWSLESGQQVHHLIGHRDTVRSAFVTPDGKHIVSGSEDESVRVWSLESDQQILQLDGHTHCVMSVCVTPDGRHIVSGSADNSVRLWSLESGEQVRCFDGHTNAVMSVCVTPDSKYIVSGADDKSVRIWSLESGQQVCRLDGHTDTVTSVCVTSDGRHIVSGSFDKSVRVWSIQSSGYWATPTATLLHMLVNQSALSFAGCQIEDIAASDECKHLIRQLVR